MYRMVLTNNTYMHTSISGLATYVVIKLNKLESWTPVDEAGALVEIGSHVKFLIERIRKLN